MASFEQTNFLNNSVIIAAHPDDEILWFSSIMQDVSEIIIVYEDYWADPELGAKRAKAVRELPHPSVSSLKIAEAGTYGSAHWSNPQLSNYGLEFGQIAILREIKRRVKRTLPFKTMRARTSQKSVWQNYCENYHLIYEKLKIRLTPEMNVFTHNPWGEYGHEEHVHLFRVVDQLRSEIGFTLWMSNYCTDRSLPLAERYFSKDKINYVRLPTNIAYAEQVANVYRKYNCWTWDDHWVWFEDECFMQSPTSVSSSAPQAHLCPLNMFSI